MGDNMRMGNLECRLTANIKGKGYWEIVLWFDDHPTCYTLALWRIDKEGAACLEFIGSRPFEKNVKRKAFWKLAKYGQKQSTKLAATEGE